MIDMNKEHKEFEQTLQDKGFPVNHLRKDKRGNYLRKNVASAFSGWVLKASKSNKEDA